MAERNGLTICLQVTYRCNLRCRWCHCGCDFLRGDGSDMTVDDVAEFLLDVAGRPIKAFRISGGEPRLLPHLLEIVEVCSRWLNFLPRCNPHVSTNGVLPGPDLPQGWHYRVDGPQSKAAYHEPVMWSPADLGLDPEGFVCRMPSFCGRGYDKRGWSFCQVAPQLGRLLGIETHAEEYDAPRNEAICRHCWYSLSHPRRREVCADVLAGKIKTPTPTWQAAIDNARECGMCRGIE